MTMSTHKTIINTYTSYVVLKKYAQHEPYMGITNNFPHHFQGLRTEEEREDRLNNLPSAYNFRLQSPAKNITTETDAKDLFPEEYQAFLNAYGPLQKAKSMFRIQVHLLFTC